MSDSPEINVQRRRKGSKPVKQATAPVRRDSGRPSSGTTSGTSTSGPSYSSGGSQFLKGTTGKLGCGGFLAIAAIVVIYFVLSGGGGLSTEPSDYEQEPLTYTEPTQVIATRTPRPTVSSIHCKHRSKMVGDGVPGC